ncbi:MAG: hypothetical protein H6738_09725 [Alphaproteobacteria bacterium]|nr:hypothetical protein [Alphaproteobacteria bacterium]MCB9697044.1 hypothetical protein [Alphaproteobacteria bacterium]
MVWVLLAGCHPTSAGTTTDTDTDTPGAATASTGTAPTGDTAVPASSGETGGGHTGLLPHTGDPGTDTGTGTGDTGIEPPTDLIVPGCPPVFTPQPADLASCSSLTRSRNSYFGWRSDETRTYDARGLLVERRVSDNYDETDTRYEVDPVYDDVVRIEGIDPFYGDLLHWETRAITRDGTGRPTLVHYESWDWWDPYTVDAWDVATTWGPCGAVEVVDSRGSVDTTDYFVDGWRVWQDLDGDGVPDRSQEFLVDPVSGATVEQRQNGNPIATYDHDPVTGWLMSRLWFGSLTTWTYDAHGRELTEASSYDYYYTQRTDSETTTWTCPP